MNASKYFTTVSNNLKKIIIIFEIMKQFHLGKQKTEEKNHTFFARKEIDIKVEMVI